jgi:DNA-binding transcriptional ArsR family regulator
MAAKPEPQPGRGYELLRDPAVLRVLAHPTRMKIYTAMVKEPLSAKDLAERLEQPLARLSYHVRTLADAGLLRPVRQTRRRSAIETHYRAIATFDISDEVLAAGGPETLAAYAHAMVRDIAEDTLDAVERGAAAERDAGGQRHGGQRGDAGSLAAADEQQHLELELDQEQRGQQQVRPERVHRPDAGPEPVPRLHAGTVAASRACHVLPADERGSSSRMRPPPSEVRARIVMGGDDTRRRQWDRPGP